MVQLFPTTVLQNSMQEDIINNPHTPIPCDLIDKTCTTVNAMVPNIPIDNRINTQYWPNQATASSSITQINPFRIKYNQIKDIHVQEKTHSNCNINREEYVEQKPIVSKSVMDINPLQMINTVDTISNISFIPQTAEGTPYNENQNTIQNTSDGILSQIRRVVCNYLENYIQSSTNNGIVPDHTQELLQYTRNLQTSLECVLRKQLDTFVSVQVTDVEKNATNITLVSNGLPDTVDPIHTYEPTPMGNDTIFQHSSYTSRDEIQKKGGVQNTLYVDPKKRYRGSDTLQYQPLFVNNNFYNRKHLQNINQQQQDKIYEGVNNYLSQPITIVNSTHNSNVSIIKNTYSDKIDSNLIGNELESPPFDIGQSTVDIITSNASNTSTLKNTTTSTCNCKVDDEQHHETVNSMGKSYTGGPVQKKSITSTQQLGIVRDDTNASTILHSIQKSNSYIKQRSGDSVITVPPATISIVADMMQKSYLAGTFSNLPMFLSNKIYDKKALQNDTYVSKYKPYGTNDTVLQPETYFTNASSFTTPQSCITQQQQQQTRCMKEPTIVSSTLQSSPLSLGILNSKYCNSMLMNDTSVFTTNSMQHEQNYQDLTQNVSQDLLKTLPLLHYKTQQQQMSKLCLIPPPATNFTRELSEYFDIQTKTVMSNHMSPLRSKYNNTQNCLQNDMLHTAYATQLPNSDYSISQTKPCLQPAHRTNTTADSQKKLISASHATKQASVLDCNIVEGGVVSSVNVYTVPTSIQNDAEALETSTTNVITTNDGGATSVSEDNPQDMLSSNSTTKSTTITVLQSTSKIKKNREILYYTNNSRRTRITQEILNRIPPLLTAYILRKIKIGVISQQLGMVEKSVRKLFGATLLYNGISVGYSKLRHNSRAMEKILHTMKSIPVDIYNTKYSNHYVFAKTGAVRVVSPSNASGAIEKLSSITITSALDE